MKTIFPYLIMFLMTLSLTITACQKKDSGPEPVVDSGMNLGGCANCVSITSAPNLLTRVQSETPDRQVMFVLDIRGAPGGSCLQGANKYIICAAGPGTMVGTMRVLSAAALCGAPVGDYIIRPLSVSTISNAMLLGGTFEAVGPSNVRVILQLQQGILTNPDSLDSNSTNNRIGLTMRIGSVVQGYAGIGACGMISTY